MATSKINTIEMESDVSVDIANGVNTESVTTVSRRRRAENTQYECPICFETSLQTITCVFCEYKTCKKCATRYIVEDTVECKCMYCDRQYTRHIMMNMFGKTFMSTTYRDKRARDLFQLELAILPTVQLQITAEKHERQRAAHLKELTTVRRYAENLQHALTKNVTNQFFGATKVTDALRAIEQLTAYAGAIIETAVANNNVVAAKKTVVTILFKCSRDACNGYVSSCGHACEICLTAYCRRCREPINANESVHVCDTHMTETVAMLELDTKPCPKCFVPITKISGCDQMFCVKCTTAFCWKTMKITTRRIHNPHYFEYLAQQGERNLADNASANNACATNGGCGVPAVGIPETTALPEWFRKQHVYMEFVRFLLHVEDATLPQFTRTEDVKKLKLRKAYLSNAIDVNKFKTEIQRIDKWESHQREMSDILGTFVTAGSDIARNTIATNEQIQSSLSRDQTLNQTVQSAKEKVTMSISALIEYVNACLKNTSAAFNFKQWRITSYENKIAPCYSLTHEE